MKLSCSYFNFRLILVVFLLSFSLISVPSYAVDTLSIEKSVQPVSVVSGGTVKVLLNINNPFGVEMNLKIRDKVSIGGTIIDTICQSATISAGSGVAEYMDVTAVMPGNYTLDPIEVKYTNPVTGISETVISNDVVVVEVTGDVGNVFKSSTQTINNCQFDDEDEQQQQQQQQEEQKEGEAEDQQNPEKDKSMADKLREMMQKNEEEKQAQTPPPQSPTQQKLSSSRQGSSQNMQSVKDGLKKQAEAMQKQLEQELDDALSEDKDFKEMEESLSDKGYELDSKDVPSLKGNETNFTYNYKDENGSEASITGNMRDGEISDLKKMSSEDQKQLESNLLADSEYQEMKENLLEQGYQMESTEFSGLDSDNKTDFKSSFSKPEGKTANITGSIEDGKPSDMGHLSDDDISNIKNALENSSEYQDMKEKLESKNMSVPDELKVEPIKDGKTTVRQGNLTASVAVSGNVTQVLDVKIDDGRTLIDKVKYPLLFLVLLMIGGSYYLYLKRKALVSVVSNLVPVAKAPKINPKKEALKMLVAAEKLFSAGDMKEAYTKVSLAVRFYFRYTIGSSGGRELTSSEVIRLLKSNGYGGVSKVRECFSLCDLVKFAKYKPNKGDFSKMVKIAREIVV